MKQLISVLVADRKLYEKVLPFITEKDLDTYTKILFQEIKEYYDTDGTAMYVDKDLLRDRIKRKYPKTDDVLIDVLDTLPSVSAQNQIKEFLAVKRQMIGDKITQALASNKEDVAESLMEEWQTFKDEEALTTRGSEVITHFDLEAMIRKQSNPEFKLRPKTLADQYGGGADRGEHIILIARPNSGKSLFCLNQVACWINDGHKVLYIGNEDRPDKLITRLVWRISGMSKEQAAADPALATQKANEKGLSDKLVFASLSPGTFPEIKALIEEHEPDIVVLDQIRNVIMKSDGLTEKLEAAAMEARNLAKYYGVLWLSVTQAGASAANKLVLSMEDIDSSKTGIQASADLIIAIGTNEEYDRQGLREISTPKNKQGSDFFHYPVKIDTQRTKVVDI